MLLLGTDAEDDNLFNLTIFFYYI